MNHRQKLGYMVLGAAILAVGITIGQFITPQLEAQQNGYFHKITCRELEVVGKDGKEAIVLTSTGEISSVLLYRPHSDLPFTVPGIHLSSTRATNSVIVYDSKSDIPGVAVQLGSVPGANSVSVKNQQGHTTVRLLSRGGLKELYGINALGDFNGLQIMDNQLKEVIILESTPNLNRMGVRGKRTDKVTGMGD